jgi:hypothetical protein
MLQHVAAGVLQRRQRARILQDSVRRRGQPTSARRPFGRFDAKLFFQSADLMADRRRALDSARRTAGSLRGGAFERQRAGGESRQLPCFGWMNIIHLSDEILLLKTLASARLINFVFLNRRISTRGHLRALNARNRWKPAALAPACGVAGRSGPAC